MTDGANKHQGAGNIASLDAKSILNLRAALTEAAHKLLGTRYYFGAEWTNYSIIPEELDCSELNEGVFHLVGLRDMPDGSQNQYNFTMPTPKPILGDLAFFGRSKDPSKIYHTGVVYDETYIIEARGFDPAASFPTGMVILRERKYWEAYKNFVGYRSHPKLIIREVA